MFSRGSVEMRLRPAPAGSGVVFAPGLAADLAHARAGDHCTVLERGGARVRAVEHLLAACLGLGVTDLAIDCPDGEPPFGDGSSRGFVRALARAGTRELGAGPAPLVVREPVLVEVGGSFAVARPGPGLRVSCVTDFPWAGPEVFEWVAGPGAFAAALAPARTVALTREPAARLRRTLRLGFRLRRRNGFVVPARRRLAGESCRHKLLDLLGDLALLGRPLNAEVFACRPGHRLNLAFARRLAASCRHGRKGRG
jgi:UDP-3-O-[3-hydroxymyristoyl] N-acetylglucosamine deacetylase